MPNSILQDLLALSHELGREDRGLAILGEGNASARLGGETFLVKASGACLGALKEDEIVKCRVSALLPMLETDNLTDQQVDNALLAARVEPRAKKPSVEAAFHAWLLSLPGVNFAGHTHPTTVNQILCSPRAADFAGHRMFPDEIVCCGPASVLVPLTDPGLKLAQAVRRETESFLQRQQRPPRVILMQNHGLITLGASWQSVLSATLMAEKAAKIFVGAAALGGPVFFSPENIARIDTRPDEAYRQRALKM
ncbi:MAG: class II aldolase/adducin family protein [Verrucomicrobiota bacterium]|jgi:rhamnose utilization protein RhaD (predicted bifunctional aldolase and dehydrogenase)